MQTIEQITNQLTSAERAHHENNTGLPFVTLAVHQSLIRGQIR